ncbi:MAG: preprotein translocase subunit SecA [Alphaproteobacteria bacterium]|nr:preprotein translocase subunit SecA [Alphaproteobacteria bacterium]
MLLALAKKMFPTSNERQLKKLFDAIAPINELEAEFEALSDAQIRAKTDEFRIRLQDGKETLEDIMPEAFAAVREAAKRTLGQRHFDVQLVGGLCLHQGKIAEMRTGEGKTLVATLPVYLNAIEGKGVHVVTVNDYLAQRDSQWMGQVYNFLGLTCGCIVGNMLDVDRQKAYACDVTYGTNNEFGFDYLRDNMKFRLDAMVQRPFNFAVVDEVDSILIDEARTPLIISGPSEGSTDLYNRVDVIIPELDEKDYELDEKTRSVNFTEKGNEKVEKLLESHGIIESGNLYDPHNISLVHHAAQALRAHKVFARDTDYIVKDGKVIIIDEFTGRMMEGRRFSDGLHQALEAKEGVEIQNENQTLASITFQNYFRLYPKLSGMTGTALTEAEEFGQIYNLGVVDIPTNLDVARIDHDDKIYKSMVEKYEAIASLIADCNARQQPVLVGTVSIEKSEILSGILKKKKIKHNVLNARYHEQEAQIIAQAGVPGAVTIATNMAGRGTDIQLGGNLDMRLAHEIEEDWKEDKKKKAQEKIHSEIEQNRALVKEAGGLFVIGTERHESRRIDNQLRGRSGRQGDPGATIFFLSVEDDLMRIFAADKMESLLKSQIGLKEGEALAHPWLSKALEKAQMRVEQQNFEIRKNLLKFDNVMNDQRKVIYEQRREIMEAGEELHEMVDEMRYGVIEDLVYRCIPEQAYVDQWDLDTLKSECQRLLGLDLPIHDWAAEEGIADNEILERIEKASDEKMESKKQGEHGDMFNRLKKTFVLQLLDQHWKEHLLALDHLRQGINLRAFGQRDPLNEYKTEAFGLFEELLHKLRETVTQTLSLVEVNTDPQVLQALEAKRKYMAQQRANATRQDPALMGLGTVTGGAAGGNTAHAKTNYKSATVKPFPQKQEFDKNNPETWGKVSRNAPCPCGSGKKFKQCHGKVS